MSRDRQIQTLVALALLNACTPVTGVSNSQPEGIDTAVNVDAVEQ